MRKSKNFLLFLSVLSLTGCTTMTRRDLPILDRVPPSQSKKVAYIEFTDVKLRPETQKWLVKEIETSGQFSQLVFDDAPVGEFKRDSSKIEEFFPTSPPNKNWDVKLRIGFDSWGFFEPYCLLFLTILPCTPPVNWALGMQAIGKDGKVLGTYFVKEEAMEVTWLFGFLLAGAASGKKKESELFQNMLNNVFSKMRADNVL